MIAVLLSLAPVFCTIVIGAVLKRRGFPGDGFWAPAERLTYFFLFPCLIVSTLAEADLAALGGVLPMSAAILTAIGLMTVGLLAARRLMPVDGPTFSSVVQGAVRQNTYIGLAVSAAFFAADGLTAAAVAIVTIVPTANVISVLVLVRFGQQAGTSPTAALFVGQIVRNPLILANALGLALNLTGIGLPVVVDEILSILGRAALAFGLLAVGAALDFRALRAAGGVAVIAVALKLLVMPAITFGACLAYGVSGVAAFVAVAFNGLPAATNAYILARQLGGNAPFMAGVITLQTAVSALTLPPILALALVYWGG